ncbi:hypothetical protein OG226_03390 [Streptomyces sp. NBC_01261]|uniref:hypothetical protein n=1 Tax=Streptomyces sp. NBC_01261 TaxID=2903802 RepID=UPI002E35809A|nr:hypothetical protein [Streptomyces sp. NBC_01261]
MVDVLDGTDGELVALAAPVPLQEALAVGRRADGSEDSGVQIVIDQDAVIGRRKLVAQVGGADWQDVRAGGSQCRPHLFGEFVLGRTAQQLRPHQAGYRLRSEGMNTVLDGSDDQLENAGFELAVPHARRCARLHLGR